MEEKDIYTEEQMDFITEMMNIGAGNASKGHGRSIIIFVKNEFVFSVKNITTWFMLATFDEHIETLMNSIEKARPH